MSFTDTKEIIWSGWWIELACYKRIS